MKKPTKFILFAIIVLIAQSCRKSTERCGDTNFQFRLTGFSKDEIDTLIVRKISPTTGLQVGESNVVSLVKYGQNGFLNYDTVISPYVVPADTLDVFLSIPGANKTVIITEVDSERPHSQTRRDPFLSVCSGKPEACFNKLYSYKLDGQSVVRNNYYPSELIDIVR